MTPAPSVASGLFSQLAPLLAHRAVLITISKPEGDLIQVNICPRQLKTGENQALTTPLCVTGTAAELDTDLVSQISSFVSLHVGLNTNLAAVEREIAEAEKAAREEAKKKQKVVVNGGKKPADNAPPLAPSAQPAPASSNAAPTQPLSLFDQQPEASACQPQPTAAD
jgi:PRTRC genetic system protein E